MERRLSAKPSRRSPRRAKGGGVTRTITTCDRCGAAEGKTWEHRIIKLSFKLPIDGINGGEESLDLCRDCRESFWRGYDRWLKAKQKEQG